MEVLRHRDPGTSAVLSDLYELTMLQTYYERRMTDTAVFAPFFRAIPIDIGKEVSDQLRTHGDRVLCHKRQGWAPVAVSKSVRRV